VLDRAVQQYVAALATAVGAVRAQLAEAGGDAAAEGAEAALPLLNVASQLAQRLAALRSGLQQAAVEAAGALLGNDSSGAAACERGLPTAAALRMSAQPALRQSLAALAAAAASAPPILPLAATAAADLEALAAACALEVLTRRPRAQLAMLPRLPEWQQRAGALPLPTFSAYPLQYVTSGERMRCIFHWLFGRTPQPLCECSSSCSATPPPPRFYARPRSVSLPPLRIFTDPIPPSLHPSTPAMQWASF
jgi:hypothetical protein